RKCATRNALRPAPTLARHSTHSHGTCTNRRGAGLARFFCSVVLPFGRCCKTLGSNVTSSRNFAGLKSSMAFPFLLLFGAVQDAHDGLPHLRAAGVAVPIGIAH